MPPQAHNHHQLNPFCGSYFSLFQNNDDDLNSGVEVEVEESAFVKIESIKVQEEEEDEDDKEEEDPLTGHLVSDTAEGMPNEGIKSEFVSVFLLIPRFFWFFH